MKNIVFLFLVFLFAGQANAQVPQTFNYQAVARNNNGQALANQTIKIRLSILDGGNSLYSETRSVTTNALGLFNVRIGTPGTLSTSGSFTTIDWANNQPEIKFIKVELDISNTNVFTDMGTQPLSSVPYTFVAENARKIGGFDVGTSEPNNEEVLQWNGSEWEPGMLRIGTKPVSSTLPNTGAVLRWDGTEWAPFNLPEQPTVGNAAGLISGIPFGGVSAPWVFAGPTVTVAVNGPQDVIIATATGVLGHNSANPQPVSFSVCWSLVTPGSPITEFMTNSYPDATVAATTNKTALTATGTITNLPAGNYKIGLGIKNKSGSANLNDNGFMNMSYQVIHN